MLKIIVKAFESFCLEQFSGIFKSVTHFLSNQCCCHGYIKLRLALNCSMQTWILPKQEAEHTEEAAKDFERH